MTVFVGLIPNTFVNTLIFDFLMVGITCIGTREALENTSK